jgi:hypothetical protein
MEEDKSFLVYLAHITSYRQCDDDEATTIVPCTILLESPPPHPANYNIILVIFVMEQQCNRLYLTPHACLICKTLPFLD